MTTTNETDETHDELAAALRGAVPPAADAYRVERVLKSAPGELTQLVYLRTAAGGELGPYVRKVIDHESGLGGAYVALAAREREGLRVRQLPRIIECGVERGSLVVVMERVPGHTLREVIEAASPAQRVELAARLMPAVCDAAEELHTTLEQPIVHRDLTPGNVMCPDGDPTTPVLIDLGIARTWHNDAETDTTHLGTRAYAPPEQYGFGQTDVRSDVYALGLLAFFCLTGRDPSPSDRERAFADPAVPEPWRAAIERAAALDPAERYQTAGELAAALGKDKLQAAADRLGLNGTLRCDGYTARSTVDLSNADDGSVAWAGIGQYTDQITAIQFLRFMGVIANGGEAAEPYLMQKISRAGQTVYEAETKTTGRLLSEETAAALGSMMRGAVVNQYGAWQFGSLTVCAKSGTAERENGPADAMFAGFVQDEAYPLAFVVFAERGGSGSQTAAPIAAKVLNACKTVLDAPNPNG